MPFTVKDWRDLPDTSTPINAAAMEDLERRLSDYTDDRADLLSTRVFDVRDYGATGNGTTDDAPAVQAACDAAGAAGGGTVYFPVGRYAILTPVAVTYQTGETAKAAGVRLKGCGSGSRILPKTGAGVDALSFKTTQDLAIEDLYFVGTAGVRKDARRVLYFNDCEVTIRGCGFYQCMTEEPDGAVLYNQGGALKLRDTQFRGCGGSGSGSNVCPVVRNENWETVVVEDVKFIDFGYLEAGAGGTANSGLVSKTGLGSPAAWIWIGNPATLSPDQNSVTGQANVYLRNIRMDEGQSNGLVIKGGSNRIRSARVQGLYVNGAAYSSSVGILAERIDSLVIENTVIGFPHTGAARPGIKLVDAGRVTLRKVVARESYSRITADAATVSLTLEDVTSAPVEAACPTHVGSAPALLDADGDLAVLRPGKGVLLTSPDGLTTKRLRLSNAGTLELVDAGTP